MKDRIDLEEFSKGATLTKVHTSEKKNKEQMRKIESFFSQMATSILRSSDHDRASKIVQKLVSRPFAEVRELLTNVDSLIKNIQTINQALALEEARAFD